MPKIKVTFPAWYRKSSRLKKSITGRRSDIAWRWNERRADKSLSRFISEQDEKRYLPFVRPRSSGTKIAASTFVGNSVIAFDGTGSAKPAGTNGSGGPAPRLPPR